MVALVQTDAELSEILMRAFILRRVELVAHGIGDAVLDRVGALVGHAAHQGVSDAQQSPLHVPRSRPRRRHPDAARSFQGRRGGRAGADLPLRARAQEPEQSGDRPLPRLQRRHRSDTRARRRDRRRRTVGAGGGRLRRVGRARRPGARIERPGRTGRLELEDRELPRVSRPAFRARSSRGAPTRRRRNSARRS